MTYSVTNKDGKIVIEMSKYDRLKPDNHYTSSISGVLTVKQARAFARNIYIYCRVIELKRRREQG